MTMRARPSHTPNPLAIVWLLAACLAATWIGGCSLGQPPPAKELFMLQAGETAAASAASAVPRAGALKIGSFGVVAPFEGRGLVYRTSEVNYASDFYNEYFVAPGAMIGQHVASYLSRARPFETIAIDARSAARYELRGVVTELYGDLRDKSQPAARLAMHVYLVRTDAPIDRVLLDRVLQQRVPLPDASAAALVKGLSSALDAALATLTRELASVELPEH
jgi:cholesterol transport system auxiliary component